MNAEEFAWALKTRGIFRHIENARKYAENASKKIFNEEDFELAWRWMSLECDLNNDINYGRCIGLEHIKPCPYCGGEVEVIRIADKVTCVDKNVNGEKKREARHERQFRIECRKCHRLVAKGLKFDIESKEDGEQRIKDYDAEMARIWQPTNRTMMLRADKRRAMKEKAKCVL